METVLLEEPHSPNVYCSMSKTETRKLCRHHLQGVFDKVEKKINRQENIKWKLKGSLESWLGGLLGRTREGTFH